MRYIALGRPLALPDGFCRVSVRTSAPPSRRSRSLLAKAGCTPPTTAPFCSSANRPCNHLPTRSARWDARLVLLNDEPIRIYVLLLLRPWVMQACHSTATCHLGSTRTLRMLERFYWWIRMSICTRWWLRHCLKCQARKNMRLTVRWHVISMPLPEGPGIAVSVDYFGPPPVMPRGNT